MTPQLQATLVALPARPGVCLMRDARSTVLDVGKAQSAWWAFRAPRMSNARFVRLGLPIRTAPADVVRPC